jgi:hypothetical protein
MNWEDTLRQSLCLVGVKEARITKKDKHILVSLPFGKEAKRVERFLESREDPCNQDDDWKKLMAAKHSVVVEARPPTKLFPAKPGKLALPYQKYATSEKDLPLAFVTSRLRYQKKTYYGYRSIWIWPDPMGRVWGPNEEKFCQGFVSVLDKHAALDHLQVYSQDVLDRCAAALKESVNSMWSEVGRMIDDTQFGRFTHSSSNLPQEFWNHLEDEKYEKHLRAAKTPSDVLKAAGKRLSSMV